MTSMQVGEAESARQPSVKRWGVLLGVGVVLLALAIRWQEASGRDLYNDEAIAMTIARSFLHDGRLNNWEYSHFLPPAQHRGETWVYYPPLFVLVQSVVLWLDPSGGNLAPRLPVALANTAALLLLPLLSRAAGRGSTAGWVAAALAIVSPFHVHSSVTALPYALMGPLLTLSLVLLVRAHDSARPRDWVGMALVTLIGVYIHPLAFAVIVLLGVVVGAAALQGDWRRARLAALAAMAIGAGGVPWYYSTLGRSTTLGSLMTVAPGYTFSGQAALLGELIAAMLPGAILRVAAGVGIASGLYELARKLNLASGLIALWALAPAAYLLSRSLWLTPRHVAFVLPAVYLATAWGLLRLVRWLCDDVRRVFPGLTMAQVRGGGVAVCLLICGAEYFADTRRSVYAEPPSVAYTLRHGDAALEFGGAETVSRACDLLRRRRHDEPVIASVGLSESYYLEAYVHHRRDQDATDAAWRLLSAGPAWVFVGDNFLRSGSFDDFDHYVVDHGELVLGSPPVTGFTAPSNTLGYGLYYVATPSAPNAAMHAD